MRKNNLLSKTVLFFSFYFLTLNGFAQNFNWAKQMGGTGDEQSHSIVVDNSGNVYSTGWFKGTVDFDPDTGVYNLTSNLNPLSSYSTDIYISKLDSLGSFLWAKNIGGSYNDRAFSIAVDDFENVYTTGFFQDTVDFDPDTGIFNLAALDQTGIIASDIFISKLNPSGNFIWAKRMGGINGDYCNSIGLDGYGNIYTTGVFSDTVDFDPDTGVFNLNSTSFRDAFICKLNSSGSFVWAKKIGGLNETFSNSIAVDASGNTYAIGEFSGTINFGNGANSLSSAGNTDVFVTKLDSSGSFQWAKNIGGADNETGTSIAVDKFGNVLTTGWFYNTCDFDPGSANYNLTSDGGPDVFISKLDSLGNFRWAKKIGGTSFDRCYSISVDTSANVYTSGHFTGTVDFDPDSGVTNLISDGYWDIFISKLSSVGSLIWAKKMGGSRFELSYSMAVDASENVYTTGLFQSTADFDPDTGNYSLSSVGVTDIFISKLSPCKNLFSIQNYSACDSYTWIDSITYTSSTNSPTFTLTNSFGCDSIVNLNLTITPNDTTVTTISDTLIANQLGAAYQWLNCDSNFQIINGATNQIYKALINGNYACEISLNGCTDTTGCTQMLLTGLENQAIDEKINLYPNPSKNQFYVESSISENQEVQLLDITGKIILQKTFLNKAVIDVSSLNNGLYLLRINNNSKKAPFIQRIVVQH